MVAADVYAVPPHTGRGGWTWYTGSAGWMYRLIVESLLGLTRKGATLRVAPCLPASWPGFKLHYRYGETTYLIAVRRGGVAGGPATVSLDGVVLPDATIPLRDDQAAHEVEIVVGAVEANTA